MVYAVASPHDPGTMRGVVVAITCCVLLALVSAIVTANAAARNVTGQLGSVLAQARRGQAELWQLAERVQRGEQATPPPPVPALGRTASGDAFRMLEYELGQANYTAGQTIALLSERRSGGGPGGLSAGPPPAGPESVGVPADRSEHRVEIFVNLARRMQSLVHREIEMLDDLEAMVEDPDLLKGLFTVDHLATRMRRQSESLAVLGGSSSRRQWSRQVNMHEVLRASVTEVEQYSRVKIVPPVEGVLRGGAVADIIHLVAELVENATKFSPPKTTALIRAQHVTAGVAIEIEDRGLGMVNEDLDRMNALLSGPRQIDIDELLADGRIGLYVVSTLAHRHGVRVRLQVNIYGGTSAIVVLPRALLEDPGDRELPRAEARLGAPAPVRAVSASAAPVAAALSAEVSAPASAPAPAATGVPLATSGAVARAVSIAATGPSATMSEPPQVRRVPGASLPHRLAPPTQASMPQGSHPRMSADPVSPYTSQSSYTPQSSYSPQSEQNPLYPPQASSDSYSDSQSAPQSSGQFAASSQSAGERPALPKRQAQATLSAQLGENDADISNTPVSSPGSNTSFRIPGAASEEPAEQMPGLMADFLRGVRESTDDPYDDGTQFRG
jgi:signal transduction histidine kinase